MSSTTFDPSAFPYDTVVRVTMTFDGARYQGSGVLISPDEVLTASHVVFSSDWGQATNITVTPDYNQGTAPYGSYSGVAVHYNAIKDPNGTITFANSEIDYAVIHLSQPVVGVGTMQVLPDYQGGAVHITGYPGSANGAMVDDQQVVIADAKYTLFDGLDTKPGSSGGPVWITTANGLPEVVGLVSSGNGANGYFVQITASAANLIDSWVASDDASILANIDWTAIQGSAARQSFAVGTGNTAIDASGYLHDTVVLHGALAQYSVTTDSSGNPTLTDLAPYRDYTVKTTGVEFFKFSDQTVAAVNSANQLIAGLYQVALGRLPDPGGLSYWEDAYNNLSAPVHAAGTTMALLSPLPGTSASIAADFVASPEFQQYYGQLSTSAFVTQLYFNALHRGPDQSGYDYWQNVMTNGDANGVHFTQAMVAASFATSPENLANITHGWFLYA